MKTNREHFINRQTRRHERGNALIYVLIAVALFAALSMTLGRQTNDSESGAISEDQAELLAAQLISYAAQTKSIADQMIFTGRGSAIDDMDFILPNAATFNTPPHINKIYHPEGGGLNPAKLAIQVISGTPTDLAAGWYLGRFNNFEWTKTAANEVILVAHQIDETVCGKINEKVTGSTAIPSLAGGLLPQNFFVDDSLHAGTNDEFNDVDCPGCNRYFSLCVANSTNGHRAFYTIIADQ